ncbi:MAG: relaxase/mobilization nuclease domain-containing protein [Muribaculaceae bacterium]|nr:relaxase/mobilization nuclease domain-containing protein [Muribaculaceae bacterium]
MIATILHSSPSFNAVYYNEQKVKDGVASLLEIKNFGPIDTFGYNSPNELVDYLKDYSSRNDRIKKPQLHVALSCKGNEMTEDELLAFAHEYLNEMGYAEPEQPLLIYAHRDTANRHLHIITSRVDPDGRKIDDHHERRRSQKVLEKLEKRDVKKKAKADITAALGFNFRNISQFRAVMEAMNYECYVKAQTVYVKKDGMVQDTIDLAIVNAAIQKNLLIPEYKLKPRYSQLWGIFKKYKNLNSSLSGLEMELKKKFGLSLVFYGSKDSPYGYSVVDFHNKVVLEGGKVMKVKELLTFQTKEEHLNQIESLIDLSFQENPLITTKELNGRLFKIGAFVKKNEINFGNTKVPLHNMFTDMLGRNNKIEWLSQFSPTSNEEREVLCKLGKISNPQLIRISPAQDPYNPVGLTELRNIFSVSDINDRKDRLDKEGFIIVHQNNNLFAYNPKKKSIIDFKKAGLSVISSEDIIPYLRGVLEQKPFITTNSLNKLLCLQGAFLQKNDIQLGDINIPIPADIAAQLKRNNLMQFINAFNLKDGIERDIICQAYNFKDKDLISGGKDVDSQTPKGSDVIKSILQIQRPMELLNAMEKEDFFICRHPQGYYAYNPKLKSIINLDSLNVPELKKDQFVSVISSLLDEDESITTWEINKRLNRLGATVQKGKITFGNNSFELREELIETLKINDTVARVNKFNPSDENERDFLCKLYKLPEFEYKRVIINSTEGFTPKELTDVKEIMKISNLHYRFSSLEDSGFKVIRHYGKVYLLNEKKQSLIDIKKHNLPDIGRIDIEAFIKSWLKYDAYVNTSDLNHQLFMMGAYISKNEIHFGEVSWNLSEEVMNQLRRNNMIDWLNSFNPVDEIERNIICRLTGFDDSSLIRINDDVRSFYYPNGLYALTQLLNIHDQDKREQELKDNGWKFIKENGETFAFNGKIGCIINLNKTDIPKYLYPYVWNPQSMQTDKTPKSVNINTLQRMEGAIRAAHRGENREWEVGKKGQDQDDPDRNSGYSY